MLTIAQVRDKAWSTLRSAETLVNSFDWGNGIHLAGVAVELMLKARICMDQKLAGWPETEREFNAVKPLKLKDHDPNRLLDLTQQGIAIRGSFLSEWGVCQQWNIETRYQPVGSATMKSAKEMLRSAAAILKHINDQPDFAAQIIASSEHPFIKLCGMEREVSDEKGDFYLFALWHRKGAHESSDLVVSAPWLNAYSREGAKYLADRVAAILPGPDINTLSGLFVLDPANYVVRLTTMAYGAKHGYAQIKNNSITETFSDGKSIKLEIDSALIITSQKPPA